MEKAALKVDLSMNKLVSPVLKQASIEIEAYGFNEDCQVHEFYQCLVDQGIEDEAFWMHSSDSNCFGDWNCYIPAKEPDFNDDISGQNQEFRLKMKNNT